MTNDIDRNKIMERLKKLLALATSSNANESASAMRQAQKLMETYAITDEELELSDISEKESRFTSRSKPSAHMIGLGNMIAQAFGVRLCLTGYRDAGKFTFIGPDPRPEVAEYTFDVLRRKLTASREEYLKTLSKKLKRSTKTNRADLFCRTWLYRVADTINEFAQSSAEIELLERYWEKHYGESSTYKAVTRKAKKTDSGAIIAGHRAAAGVVLNHGVNGKAPSNRLSTPQGKLTAGMEASPL